MNIQFCWGASRFVILVGPYAIKIARFRPFYFLWRIVYHFCMGKLMQKINQHRGDSFLKSTFRFIFMGIYANKLEYQLYKKGWRPELVPTIFSIWGLVNLQMRGEPVSDDALRACNPFADLAKDPVYEGDLIRGVNFSRFGGDIRLHDYGNPQLRVFL